MDRIMRFVSISWIEFFLVFAKFPLRITFLNFRVYQNLDD